MITRFSVLPDDRRLLLGIDKANLFKAGVVYEAYEILGEIIIKEVGAYALPSKGCPSEFSTVDMIITSGVHLHTREELERIYGKNN